MSDPMTALRTAAEAFRRYEQLHQAKVSHVMAGLGAVDLREQEAAPLREKVKANRDLAEMCEAAIPTLYAMGLLTEEMGESLKLIGKGMRFGLDSPGPAGEEYGGSTARKGLSLEVGDCDAAGDYAQAVGLVDADTRHDQARRKLGKLLDPTSVDNLGRRLAPDPVPLR